MARSSNYNTKQKDLVINEIKKHKDFAINDIYDALKGKVGLTTIYRQIDKMIKEGTINKFVGKDNITYYQYLEECDKENHFFLKCEVCGDVEHVDCDCINELSEHILDNHNFKLDKNNLIINGVCDKCSKK